MSALPTVKIVSADTLQGWISVTHTAFLPATMTVYPGELAFTVDELQRNTMIQANPSAFGAYVEGSNTGASEFIVGNGTCVSYGPANLVPRPSPTP